MEDDVVSLHKHDINMKSDEEYLPGDLSFLVKGNICRLLDGRRTEGYIEEYYEESAMFRWRITKFEDKGDFWDLDAEQIKNFQFEKDSKSLSKDDIDKILKNIEKYQEFLKIEATEEARK